MFKLYADPELSELYDYPSLASIFDPRINKTYFLGQRMTAGNYFKILRSLYLRENILQAPGLYFKELIDHYPEFRDQDRIKGLLKGIPDEHLVAFSFMKFFPSAGKQRWSLYSPVITARPSRIGINITEAIIESSFQDIPTHVQKHYEKLLGFFQTVENQLLDTDRVHPTNEFANKVFLTAVGSLPVLYNDDSARIREIPELINQRPEIQVRLSQPEAFCLLGGNFSVLFQQKVTKEFREPLYRKLSYTTNPCNLLTWPLIEQSEHSPVLYGVELEASFDYEIKTLIDAQYEPFFIAKDDSTITGSKRHRAELVTIPMSLKAHKRHWAHWFKQIDYSRFDTTKDTNNGFHVHIDKKAFNDERHIRNMTWFYLNPANKDFLVYASERGTIESMRLYSPIIQFPLSLSKVQAFRRCVNYATSSRGIVNFQKQVTVEIRMFRGIASFAELVKNLEFVDAVFSFTQGEHNIGSLSLPSFMKWLNETHRNRYTVLKEFLTRCKTLRRILELSQLQSVLFTELEPSKVFDLVNKSGLSLNNHHVTYLNRGRKRTYILGKDNKLQLIEANRSRLVDLDRVIEAKYTHRTLSAGS